IKDLNFNLKNYLSLFENLDYKKLKGTIKMKVNEKLIFEDIIYRKRKYQLAIFKSHDALFLYFKDLTGIIFYQEQIKKSQELSTLGKFSSMVAHELRNPLSTIRTSAETILEDTKNEDDLKLLTYIIEESERLSNLIGKMLNFSREINIEKEYVNIKDFILRIQEEYLKRFNDITINVLFKSSILFCDIDKELMKNVIQNILDNAYKAIKRKGKPGIIDIETERIKDHIVISVSDNGEKLVGNIDDVFKPFYTTDTNGFGLGLSIVKKIIDAHKGRIEFESKRNKKTFKIVLRCKR
ncbi:GHKL domain-containing protein, partial [bacterium]|nr:GHKL domain-containing protein [bacterium]